MHHKLPLKIKNWKLALLALFFILVFMRLGFWQLSRAHEKTLLLQSFAGRIDQLPLTAADFGTTADLRFRSAKLDGYFDNAHTFLLDNKIQEGKVGYEVYTPFHITQLNKFILVDRGFISVGQSRSTLPVIKTITGAVTITGMINVPPTYFALGQMQDSPRNSWPMRIEYLDLKQARKFFNKPVFDYVLSIKADDPAAYDIKWQIVTMNPEKHMGYAVQWFAFALTLLIISVVLNRR